MKGRPGNPGLKGRLLDKSVEAYVLALETINRLSIKYRVETFCYLICNSWELLLKAKILNDTEDRASIIYPCKRGEPQRTLSLRDCLNKVFPSTTDPVRRNVERVAELRDESVHLVIASIPRDVLCMFQASVINWHNKLNSWFSVSLSDRIPVGMMAIVYDVKPQDVDFSSAKLKRELGKQSFEFLARYCASIKNEHAELQNNREFSIGIKYNLVLTSKPDDADITLSAGADSDFVSGLFDRPRDAAKTHPLLQKDVQDKVNDNLILETKINRYDLQSVIIAHGIKKRSDFHYKSSLKWSLSQYNESFVNWIVTKYRQDDQFFQKARALAKKAKRTTNHPIVDID